MWWREAEADAMSYAGVVRDSLRLSATSDAESWAVKCDHSVLDLDFSDFGPFDLITPVVLETE